MRRLSPSLAIPLCLILLLGCDTHCISEKDVLWAPGYSEYRLELTNSSPFMIELWVSGESIGIFCSGVENLPVGNFPKDSCSEIYADFFDNPTSIHLDDCTLDPPGECKNNNTEGRICYDTEQVEKVVAVLD